MASTRGRQRAAAVDFHPNLQIQPPQVDAGRIVLPIAKIIGAGISIALLIIAGTGAYYSIINRIDRIDDRMMQQGRAIENLAASVRQLASEALTASDLRAACMQMQIANSSKGWVCPFAGVDPKLRASAFRPPVDWPATTTAKK